MHEDAPTILLTRTSGEEVWQQLFMSSHEAMAFAVETIIDQSPDKVSQQELDLFIYAQDRSKPIEPRYRRIVAYDYAMYGHEWNISWSGGE